MTTHSFPPLTSAELDRTLDQAIEDGARCYFADCRDRVAPFVARHFQYPGAMETNRHALGWDLLRAPFNLFWAPVYLLLMLIAWGFRRIRWARLARWINRIPAGLDTQVQRYLVRLTYQELLQRPQDARARDGLKEAIHRELATALGVTQLDEQKNAELEAQINGLIEEALNHYAISRTASADISNSVISMLVGAFAFHKYTPGGLAIGLYGAAILAKWIAVGEFWGGPWLGKIYYALVPVTPSASITLMSVGITLILLAVLACFSGVFIDPIQSALGIHQWRLKRLIDHLEKDFSRQTRSSFRPKEPYLARLLDLLDVARTHLT
jgi:hypothetical protein